MAHAPTAESERSPAPSAEVPAVPSASAGDGGEAPSETSGAISSRGRGSSSSRRGKFALAPPTADGYDTFSRDELAIVMSHYDIGPLRQLEDYPRGSRRAPKLLVRSANGRYLLKRRARRDDAQKVKFCHAIQRALSEKQYPLPHLITTRDTGSTLLELDGLIYELFEYIPGHGYNQSLESTFDAGRVLALYHKLLEDFHSEFEPPAGSYHAAPAVEKGFERIIRHFRGRKDVFPTCRFLLDSYLHARDSVEDAGISTWPAQIVHGDWHPGNMLFRDGRVVAVIDYDSARILPRSIDSANGALQFSILGGGDDVSKWPDYPDESRFKRFLRGYDEVMLLSEAELRATPWLMVEALVAEAVFPIAATGQFGKLEGTSFLSMVQRKVVWLQRNADRLVQLVGE